MNFTSTFAPPVHSSCNLFLIIQQIFSTANSENALFVKDILYRASMSFLRHDLIRLPSKVKAFGLSFTHLCVTRTKGIFVNKQLTFNN